jgi:phosphate transport system protein
MTQPEPSSAALDPAAPPAPGAPAPESHFERELGELKRRLVREAVQAVAMLEQALAALWKLDKNAAREIRRRDDTIDREEVAIEQAALRVMALQHPYGRDFRVLAFVLKVNADVERVADHATSIAKVAMRIERAEPPAWPTALVELGQRVPMMCHALLRALMDEDADAAREVVKSDETIDELDRRLFAETVEWMEAHPGEPQIGILITRLGRELERVGDLMASIAEDIVYVATGAIIRHEKRMKNPPAASPSSALPSEGG